MLVEIKRICSQVIDIPEEDADDAIAIAKAAAAGMPEDDFNIDYEVNILQESNNEI